MKPVNNLFAGRRLYQVMAMVFAFASSAVLAQDKNSGAQQSGKGGSDQANQGQSQQAKQDGRQGQQQPGQDQQRQRTAQDPGQRQNQRTAQEPDGRRIEQADRDSTNDRGRNSDRRIDRNDRDPGGDQDRRRDLNRDASRLNEGTLEEGGDRYQPGAWFNTQNQLDEPGERYYRDYNYGQSRQGGDSRAAVDPYSPYSNYDAYGRYNPYYGYGGDSYPYGYYEPRGGDGQSDFYGNYYGGPELRNSRITDEAVEGVRARGDAVPRDDLTGAAEERNGPNAEGFGGTPFDRGNMGASRGMRDRQGMGRRGDMMAAQQVSGEIVDMRTVDMFGNRHVIAQMRGGDGQTFSVDLGPENRISELNLRPGSQVRVDGRRGLLSAGRVSTDGGSVTIDPRWAGDRVSQRMETRGVIESMRTSIINGQEKQIAYVVDDRGDLRRVDLGSVERLSRAGIRLNEGDSINIRGRFGQVEGVNVLTAEQISPSGSAAQQGRFTGVPGTGGEVARIPHGNERGRLSAEQLGDESGRTSLMERGSANIPAVTPGESDSDLNGRITYTWAEDRGGARHQYATVELQNGSTVEVDLGERSGLTGVAISRGDSIRFRGERSPNAGGNDRISASHFQLNDEQWRAVQQPAPKE